MDIDELKINGNSSTKAPCKPAVDEHQLAIKLAASRVISSKDRIMRHFKVQAVAGLAMPFLVFGMDFNMPMWLLIVYSVFGIGMALWALVVMLNLRDINFFSLPVSKALQHIIRLRRQIALMRAVGIVVAVFLVLSLGIEIFAKNEPYMFYGFIAGLIVGLPIGICRWITVNRQTRRLEEALRACEEPCV